MKLFGRDVLKKDFGYFGIRRCDVCKTLRDVDLLEITGVERFLGIKTKNLGVRRFLVCSKCGASFEINADLWNYYSRYAYRFNKQTTDQVVAMLDGINGDLKQNNVILKLGDKTSLHSLNLIYHNLCKKFDNPDNIEEIMSVYFS